METIDKKPRMIDWLKELENRIPEGDLLYEQFHEFKNKALAYRKEKIEDIFTGRNEQLVNDYSWLKNLPDPNDSDGDFPNIKGLKDLLDDITKYTFSWAKTGIKDIDDNMIKVGTCVSTCKSIIEGKNPPVSDLVMKMRCPHCKEEIVASPIVEEKKLIKKDDRLQAFTLPCDTCNCRKESIHRRALMNDLRVKLDAASADLFKLGVNKERLTLGEIKTAESKIRNEVYACRSAIHQIIQQTAIESWSNLTQLDENIIIGPQVGVFPSRRFSTSDVMNTVVDQENLNTKGSLLLPRHPHSEPAMISWVDKLDSLMSKDDPDYDRFQKFKELWKEIIATGIATKNLRLNSDMPYGPQTTGRLIFSPPNSKDKEEDIMDNTVEQINELKHRLRTLPDPRYLPNANYTRKLIDELDDLLNGSNVIKAKDNTYILNADTLYNAVAKLSAIRNAVSKPGMWVDSQTSAWIHLNKDFETLKTLKSYLETEVNKDTDDDPLCIITSSTINHMIELIDDALNLYAVDPE